MAYQQSHLLLVAHGTMPSGSPWSCGLRTGTTAERVWTQADLDTVGLAAANAWQTMRNNSQIGWSQSVTLDGVTARAISEEGKTTALSERSPSVATVATNTPMMQPSQCSIVATLQTAIPSRRAKGRIYLPILGITLNEASKGRIPASTALNLANAVKTVITSINSSLATVASTDSPKPVISIQTQMAVGPLSASTPVISVRVGDVFDTQRRRRDNLTEMYQTVTL